MESRLELLSPTLVERILEEAFQLLVAPGIKVQSVPARALLAEGGALVDEATEVVGIPEALVRSALESTPGSFILYDRFGKPAVHYSGDAVHFDPGSCGVQVLDPKTRQHLPSMAADLVRLVKVAEMLPQYDAQSTALVCNDVPEEIGDLYRLFLVLSYSGKPIVTGAFDASTAWVMFEMLSICAGGDTELKRKPLAVFDVCPTPPLIWSDFAAQNLVDLARAGIPAQIVSMPLAGAAGPVTLLGCVVQHAAETLAGITLHQLAGPGSPMVWGGAAAIFDMRHGTTPMGAVETAMINLACAQVGKSLDLPTHAYLGASDAKLVDAQAGLESGMTALVGALAGINMISGAGMLDFLTCQSPEKLVLDAEVIAMCKRLLAGLQVHTETLALELFAGIDFKPDFLKQKITRRLFREEQHLPSAVIDRGSIRGWQEAGGADAFARAKVRVDELLAAYQPPEFPADQEAELRSLVRDVARKAGMDGLPGIEDY
jgi:trimethylamine--corrinoid protein Co-methyltransferase